MLKGKTSAFFDVWCFSPKVVVFEHEFKLYDEHGRQVLENLRLWLQIALGWRQEIGNMGLKALVLGVVSRRSIMPVLLLVILSLHMS